MNIEKEFAKAMRVMRRIEREIKRRKRKDARTAKQSGSHSKEWTESRRILDNDIPF